MDERLARRSQRAGGPEPAWEFRSRDLPDNWN
jgi:hypothetical protein